MQVEGQSSPRSQKDVHLGGREGGREGWCTGVYTTVYLSSPQDANTHSTLLLLQGPLAAHLTNISPPQMSHVSEGREGRVVGWGGEGRGGEG